MPDWNERQTWWFTFGAAHGHPDGFFVVEDATGDEARELMLATFGRDWAFQYDEGQWWKHGVSQEEKYGLHEIGRVPVRPPLGEASSTCGGQQ